MKKKQILGECFAEFIGCLVFILIGCGAVASSVLTSVSFSQWEMSIVWGIGVTVAIYLVGSISGAHLNPAVTISLTIHRNFDKRKILPYIASQILGCFSAAAIIYFIFNPFIESFELTNNIIRASEGGVVTAGIFSTFPNANINLGHAFLVEAFITNILMIAILAIGEEKSTNKPGANLQPLMVGLTIAIIGSAFGTLTGFAMNPARDFGPRLFSFLAGWSELGPVNTYYFLIPIIAPIVGAILAGFIYDNLIKKYLINNTEA